MEFRTANIFAMPSAVGKCIVGTVNGIFNIFGLRSGDGTECLFGGGVLHGEWLGVCSRRLEFAVDEEIVMFFENQFMVLGLSRKG